MSTEDWILLGFFVLFILAFGMTPLWTRLEEKRKWSGKPGPLYTPRLPFYFTTYLVLPAFLTTLFIIDGNWQELLMGEYAIPILVCVLYYGLLLLLRPVYRRFLRPESCAFLWTLCWLPFYFRRTRQLRHLSRWMITLPVPYPGSAWLWWPVTVWFIGFWCVLLWYMVSHICYRKWLFRESRQVCEGIVLEVFKKQRNIVSPHFDDISVWVSGRTRTPVSIGLFLHTTCIVLPEKDYTKEELELIFFHELVHISRRDSTTKLGMAFCTALMWFNPFVWIATKKCADDLELSCDEAVLYRRDSEARRQYAELLLQTTASEWGFTTCLSASAKALRYRLKGVMNPRKRIVGSAVSVILLFAVFMGIFCLGFRFQAEPASRLIFDDQDLSGCQEASIMDSWGLLGGESSPDISKPQQLIQYLAGMSLYPTVGRNDVRREDYVQISFLLSDISYHILMGERYMKVIKVSDDFETEYYYELEKQPDWEYICSCLEQ